MSKDSSNTDASFTLENLKQAIERFKEYKPSLDEGPRYIVSPRVKFRVDELRARPEHKHTSTEELLNIAFDDYSMGLLDDVDILTWRRR